MAGIAVNFTGAGGGSASGVTDGSGNVTFSGLAADTYTRTAVAPAARFVTTSASAAVTCGTTATLPIAFTIASGFTCGDPSFGSPCSPRPVANTLFLTDPILGSVTLTFSGSSWSGTLTVSRSSVRDSACSNAATRNVTITYGLTPVGPSVGGHLSQWQLTIDLPYCLSGGVKFLIVAGAVTSAGTDEVSGTTTSGGCPETGAVTVALSFASAAANVLQSIYGSGTQSFTFSE
jgi:hypothetical protein